jgi:hypothetical protein
MRGALGACAATLARSVVKPAGILPSLQQASQHVRRDRFSSIRRKHHIVASEPCRLHVS